MQVPAVWADNAASSRDFYEIDLGDNRLSGLFPREWSQMGKIYILSLGSNQGLSGCVPVESIEADGILTYENTGVAGLCKAKAAEVEARQVKAVQAHLVPLLGAGAGHGYITMLKQLVEEVAGLGNMVRPGQTTSEINRRLSSVNWLVDVTIGIQLFESATYITGIEVYGGDTAGLNLTHLVPLVQSLPRLESFKCSSCSANSEPGLQDLQLPVQLAQAALLLKYLKLTGCGLGGSLPSAWGCWTSLEELLLGAVYCTPDSPADFLTGSIPASYANMARLKYLNLCNNQQLTGTPPPEFGSAGMMPIDAQFRLGDTGLHGSIPPSWSHFSRGSVGVGGSNISLDCTPDGLMVYQRYTWDRVDRPCSGRRPDVNALVALQRLLNTTGGVSNDLAAWNSSDRGSAGEQLQHCTRIRFFAKSCFISHVVWHCTLYSCAPWHHAHACNVQWAVPVHCRS